MSRVFWPSTGMRASTSPGARSWPSRIWISEPTGKPIVTEWSVPGIFTSLPAASSSLTCGRTTLAAPRRFGSITTSVDRPVTSSTCLATVTPSSTFSNFALPANSVMIGRVSGSQLASTVPALICWSALTLSSRAVRHLVALALAAVLVGDDDLAGTRNHHQLALAVGHVAHRGVEADDAVGLGVDAAEPPPRATPHRRCGRCASSAACPARRSTARRSRRSPRRR